MSGIEVAGVVLGVLPVALSTIPRYKKATQSYQEHEARFSDLRSRVELLTHVLDEIRKLEPWPTGDLLDSLTKINQSAVDSIRKVDPLLKKASKISFSTSPATVKRWRLRSLLVQSEQLSAELKRQADGLALILLLCNGVNLSLTKDKKSLQM